MIDENFSWLFFDVYLFFQTTRCSLSTMIYSLVTVYDNYLKIKQSSNLRYIYVCGSVDPENNEVKMWKKNTKNVHTFVKLC